MSDDNAINLRQLIEQVVHSNKTKSPLCIQGGSSKTFYGHRVEGEALDVRPLRGIISYDPTELVCTVAAGTSLEEVKRTLAEQGQMMPFEPPAFEDNATIGGTISCGFSGPRRPYSGSARDFVLGIDLITGKGEHLSFGGQVMKNVAGYDVSRLVVGSLGTLGAITQVSMKVFPKPAVELTLMYETDAREVIEKLCRWSNEPWPISAAAHRDGHLRIRLSGTQKGVAEARSRLGGEIDGDGEAFWADLNEQRFAEFNDAKSVWRLSVPPATPHQDFDVPQIIDWGGAQRWLLGDVDEEKLRTFATQNNGHASFFRGDSPPSTIFQTLTPVIARLHQNLKTSFDPNKILNRGKMYADI